MKIFAGQYIKWKYLAGNMSGKDIYRAIFANISRAVNFHEWVGENICDISAACDFTPCKWEFAPSVGMVETKCSVIDFRNLLLAGKCFTFKTQNFKEMSWKICASHKLRPLDFHSLLRE